MSKINKVRMLPQSIMLLIEGAELKIHIKGLDIFVIKHTYKYKSVF